MPRAALKHGLLSFAIALLSLVSIRDAHAQHSNPSVVLETSRGTIEIELFAKEAPISVANFLAYSRSGFFNGTICHRVIPDYMIQCGGFTPELSRKPTRPAIRNEADNGLQNQRGTIAMARRPAANSATAQFFINVADNAFLDHGARDFGYAVFGRVVDGMDVVDEIASTETAVKKGHKFVPVVPVVVLAVQLPSES